MDFQKLMKKNIFFCQFIIVSLLWYFLTFLIHSQKQELSGLSVKSIIFLAYLQLERTF